MFDPQQIGFVDYTLVCPELHALETSFATIREEYLNAQQRLEWAPLHWDMGYSGSQQTHTDVGWNTAVLLGDTFTEGDRLGWAQKGLHSELRGGITYFHNAALLPTLTRCVVDAKLTTRAALTRLQAHSTLAWHKDWDPCPPGHVVIRVLWGLDVPQETGQSCFMEIELGNGLVQHRTFANNLPFVFWSQCRHRVVNTLSTPRVVIGLDIVKPIEEVFHRLSQGVQTAQGITAKPKAC
jgi:hypothetical protein